MTKRDPFDRTTANDMSYSAGDLQIGDRVVLARGTLAWSAEMALRDKIGEVIERHDGRVTVLFPRGRVLPKRQAAVFERLEEAATSTA